MKHQLQAAYAAIADLIAHLETSPGAEQSGSEELAELLLSAQDRIRAYPAYSAPDAERPGVDIDAVLRDALTSFFAQTGVLKKDFAAKYGCNPPHLSAMLAGRKKIGFQKFANACHAFGYSPNVQVQTQKWTFAHG